jgi:hypothetical protein
MPISALQNQQIRKDCPITRAGIPHQFAESPPMTVREEALVPREILERP